jgi:hypothetical protein
METAMSAAGGQGSLFGSPAPARRLAADLDEGLALAHQVPAPRRPGFERGSDTSEAAAQRAEPVAGAMRSTVLAAVLLTAARGATCDELEVLVGLRHQTCSARVRELVLLGSLVDSGQRRPTRSGRLAAVYLVTPAGLESRLPARGAE